MFKVDKCGFDALLEDALKIYLKKRYMIEEVLIDFDKIFHLHIGVGHEEVNVKIMLSS
jgi:hypothetical protein